MVLRNLPATVVPGAPDAWLTALARYGKLSFAEVVLPAIELAECGFVVVFHHDVSVRSLGLPQFGRRAERRQRVHRVGRLDDQGPEAVGVVGQDLLGDHVAGGESADHARFAGARPAEYL